LQFLRRGVPKIVDKLRVLDEVGLSYLRLGQVGPRRSPVAKRNALKLAAPLAASGEAGRAAEKKRSEKHRWRTLYIFDEPTTGLHFDDCQQTFGRPSGV